MAASSTSGDRPAGTTLLGGKAIVTEPLELSLLFGPDDKFSINYGVLANLVTSTGLQVEG